MSDRVYRVTVRGRFQNLSDSARSYLAREQAAHDIFVSAFTEEGTFTYDERILFFNLRYEVRLPDGSEKTPDAVALTEAETFLRTLGYTHSALKVAVSDVSAIWNESNQ